MSGEALNLNLKCLDQQFKMKRVNFIFQFLNLIIT